MKILWVKTDFLHPTTRGGQIRTLEMLRRMHARHEIHYVAFDDPGNDEGVRRSGEYSTRSYPIPHRLISKQSAKFAVQLAAGFFSERKYPRHARLGAVPAQCGDDHLGTTRGNRENLASPDLFRNAGS
jgi:hypothetical protein